MNLISRDDLIGKLDNYLNEVLASEGFCFDTKGVTASDVVAKCTDIVYEMPVISYDIKTKKHAKWEIYLSDNFSSFRCSQCGTFSKIMQNYCCQCGAKMDWDKDDNICTLNDVMEWFNKRRG